MIKHVTIDLWLTLIKADSSYKSERATRVLGLLQEAVGYKGTPKGINTAITKVDSFHTMLCEKTGLHNMSLVDMWFMVANELNIPDITLETVTSIISHCNELFAVYPPELIDPKAVEILKEINDMGISIDIISNTGFITGTTLRRTLLNNTFGKVVRAMFFSDATILAKPNPEMFLKSLHSLRLNIDKTLQPENIFHIGDSETADFNGAKAAGFHASLINAASNLQLKNIPDLIKRINRQ